MTIVHNKNKHLSTLWNILHSTQNISLSNTWKCLDASALPTDSGESNTIKAIHVTKSFSKCKCGWAIVFNYACAITSYLANHKNFFTVHFQIL